MENKIEAFSLKMKDAGLSENVINNFRRHYQQLIEGNTGKLSRNDIEAPNRLNLISYDSLTKKDDSLLNKLAVIKLNGGLGTGMGLEKAKSLLPVKGELNFLDILANQTMALRAKYQTNMPLILIDRKSVV